MSTTSTPSTQAASQPTDQLASRTAADMTLVNPLMTTVAIWVQL